MADTSLPTRMEPYVIAEEFCGDCGRSIGYDVRPLTLRCKVCALIHDAVVTASQTDSDSHAPSSPGRSPKTAEEGR